jgi:hypothetical protein
MKKLPIDATTFVSIANRPNLYFFYLQAIVAKQINGRSFKSKATD